jgi:hypothetical protein
MKYDVKNRTAQRNRRKQGGYAILLVLFFVTLLLLMTISVAPNILTQGRRQKEIEMIWRGKQYSRAVKLYYRKTGKFPTSMDDLIKPTVGNIRFIRQAYKDPMNTKEGEWRLIYVGPNGQLIGSLKPPQTLQLSGLAGAAAPPPGTPAAQVGAQSSGQGIGQAFGQSFGNPGAATSSAGANTMGQLGGAAPPNSSVTAGPSNTPSGTGADTTSADSSANPSDAANEALLASDPTTVMGGNIIGVGSKVNQRSILVYDKAKNYKQFEFIWDPAKDAIIVGGAPGTQIGTPTGQPGQSGTFGSPANPMSGPTSNPSSNPNSPGAPPIEPPAGPPETTSPQQ